MCLSVGEMFFYLFLMGLVYFGLPILLIFLIIKLLGRKNKLPYNLP